MLLASTRMLLSARDVLNELLNDHSVVLFKDSIYAKSQSIISQLKADEKAVEVGCYGGLDSATSTVPRTFVSEFLQKAKAMSASATGGGGLALERLFVYDLFNEIDLLQSQVEADGSGRIDIVQIVQSLKECCRQLVIVYHLDLQQQTEEQLQTERQLDYLATLQVQVAPLPAGVSNDADGMLTFSSSGFNAAAAPSSADSVHKQHLQSISSSRLSRSLPRQQQSYLYKRSDAKGHLMSFKLI